LRNANDIIENLTGKLELITDAVHFIKDKVDGLSSTMGIMNTLVGGLAEKFLVKKLLGKKIENKIAEKKKSAKKKPVKRKAKKKKKK
jgi:hypothetical protein